MTDNYDIKSKIYGRVCGTPPPKVWSPGDFADFGPAEAVSKALQRLEASGSIRRIDRGLYDRPRQSRLTGKPTPPDYRAVIDAIARRDQARILIDGMTAANDLGLSDAVPGRVIVHSDARLKSVRVGNLKIEFKLTSASKLYWAGRPAMRLVQALHWLKPKLNDPSDSQRVKRRLNALLSEQRKGPALLRDLKQGMSTLPTWMQEFLADLLPTKNKSRPTTPNSTAKQKKNPAT